MGNRAMIMSEGKNYGVYLHWNGGNDSVSAFLEYCEMRNFRGFDDGYGMARFTQVVSNYFGADGLSIGIEECTNKENNGFDNGIYIVKDWEIVKCINGNSYHEGYDKIEMLIEIDNRQPTDEQLGKDYITAEKVSIYDLAIGDKVFIIDRNGNVKNHTVVGIGAEGAICNGRKVAGVPFIDKYENNGSYESNSNNYLCYYADKENKIRVNKR